MIQFSLMEKMNTLFGTIISSPFFIFLIIFFILLGIVLFDTIRYEQRKIKKAYATIYILIFVAIIIKYNASLLQLLDYLVSNIFIIIYYPNFAIYILMILISNILVLRAVFKRNMSKLMKTINIVFYCLKMYLMILILDNMTTNNIDVYSMSSIYSNNNLTMLVEISSSIFFIWIITLFIIWLINKLTNIILNKEEVKTTQIVRQEKSKNKITTNNKEDIFTEEDYKIMLKIIQLSREDEYVKEKLKTRL